ncbi:hypothetical protein A2U01_0053024, partial [Trifolium medium]|nr:hypothetical protein [Trifolium medium]
MKAEPRRCAWH